MKPGPKLDAVIAEKVMGWKWCSSYHGWTSTGKTRGPCAGQGRSFHPSTSIESVWDVVSLLEKSGFFLELKTIVLHDGRRWWANFQGSESAPWTGVTVSHAICMAARQIDFKQ